ncbi:MAG: DJ-1/PfpI family protein, partial [Mycobacterium sp.]
MTRSVVILGFQGIQVLDAIGSFEVFTAASTCLAADGRNGYQPVLASVDGQPVTTRTGLTLAATPLPDPRQPVDTVVLPGGRGVDAARRDPQTIAWIQTVA